jgi:hypothetical protein
MDQTLYHCTIEHDRTGAIARTVALWAMDAHTCEVQSLRDSDLWYTLPVSDVVLLHHVEPPDALIAEAGEADVVWTWDRHNGWAFTPARDLKSGAWA